MGAARRGPVSAVSCEEGTRDNEVRSLAMDRKPVDLVTVERESLYPGQYTLYGVFFRRALRGRGI